MRTPRSLNVQAIALVAGSGIAQVLVALLYVMTARSMSPENYGPVVTAIGFGLVGAGFIDLGSTAYWIREIASHQITHEEFLARAQTRLAFASLAGALATAGTLPIAPVYSSAGVILVGSASAQTMLIPLRATQRAEAVALLTVFGRLIAVVVFLAANHLGFAPGTALWVSLSSGDLALGLCAYCVTPAPQRVGLRMSGFRNPWQGAKWYAVSTLGTTATQLDLPILAMISGSTAAGIYGGVNRWTQPVLVAIGGFTQAAAPIIASGRRMSDLRPQLVRASWILLVAVSLSLLMFFAAPWLVTTTLGADFAGSGPVLRLLAIGMLLNIINQPLTVALQSRRYDHVAAGLVAATAVTQLLVTSILASRFGSLSAGIGVVSGQVVALLGAVYFFAFYGRRGRAN